MAWGLQVQQQRHASSGTAAAIFPRLPRALSSTPCALLQRRWGGATRSRAKRCPGSPCWARTSLCSSSTSPTRCGGRWAAWRARHAQPAGPRLLLHGSGACCVSLLDRALALPGLHAVPCHASRLQEMIHDTELAQQMELPPSQVGDLLRRACRHVLVRLPSLRGPRASTGIRPRAWPWPAAVAVLRGVRRRQRGGGPRGRAMRAGAPAGPALHPLPAGGAGAACSQAGGRAGCGSPWSAPSGAPCLKLILRRAVLLDCVAGLGSRCPPPQPCFSCMGLPRPAPLAFWGSPALPLCKELKLPMPSAALPRSGG